MSTKRAKCIFVLPDQHYAPAHDREGGVDPLAESVALQALEVVKPTAFVNLGDAGEFSSCNHYIHKKVGRDRLTRVVSDLSIDAEAVNAGLDKWDKTLHMVGCKEKHFILGNHERFVQDIIDEFPQIEELYAPHKLLRLKERGYKHYPVGSYVQFGKLMMAHGEHHNSRHHAYNALVSTGKSLLYGHNHSVQQYRIPTLDGERGAWSIGCIAKLNKPFMGGRPTPWSHAFAIVHLERGGNFQVEICEIRDGKCHVWGNLIRG